MDAAPKGKPIGHTLVSLPLLVCLMFIGPWAQAGEIDPVGKLFCNASEGVECHAGGRIGPFNPESKGLPKKFFIDFAGKMIQPDKDSLVRQSTRIRWFGRVENRLVLLGASEGVEGVDDGVAWSMSLSRSDGQFVITVSGDRIGFVVFGTCWND